MDSEDEDIIFENSALHQALIDSGVTNVETQPRVQMAEEDCVLNSNVGIHSNKNSKMDNRGSKYSLWERFFLPTVSLEELRLQKMNLTLQRQISSKLISEEDKYFFQFFINEEDQPTPIDLSQVITVWNFPSKVLLGLTFLMFNICAILGLLRSWVILLLELNPSLLVFQPYAQVVSVALANLLWIFLILIPVMKFKTRILNKVIGHLDIGDKMIQDLEKEAWELMFLEKKCSRLIKESELVARGFTIASQQRLTSSGGYGDADTPLDRWCPELREIMLTGNITLMAQIKKNVVTMMRGVPMMTKDSDFNTLEEMTTDFINCNEESEQNSDKPGAGVPSQSLEVENGMTERNKETPMLNRIVPPAQVNKSVNLLSLYISGFVRRLALCFNVQNFKDKNLDPYDVTRECIENSKVAMAKVRSALNQSYTFYRAAHQASQLSGFPTVAEWTKANDQSEIYHLYVCVNSLDLHLQSVLQVTRDLTLTLEKRLDSERRRQSEVDKTDHAEQTDCSSISNEDRQVWEAILKQVKTNLESCKMCHDESLKRLCQKPDPEVQASGPVDETNAKSNQQQQQRIRIIPAEDPVIVDQVFEALVEEGDDEDVTMSRPRYTAEDRARIQEQRDTMKKLRQEIQAVLGVRAISQREREEKALARARGEESGETSSNLTERNGLEGHIPSQTITVNSSAREIIEASSSGTKELSPHNMVEKKELETVSSNLAEKKSTLAASDDPLDLAEGNAPDKNTETQYELHVDGRETTMIPSCIIGQVKADTSPASSIVSNIEPGQSRNANTEEIKTVLTNENSEPKSEADSKTCEETGNVRKNGYSEKSLSVSAEDSTGVGVNSSDNHLIHATHLSNDTNSQTNLEQCSPNTLTGHRHIDLSNSWSGLGKKAEAESLAVVDRRLMCNNSEDEISVGENEGAGSKIGLDMAADSNRITNGASVETFQTFPGEITSEKQVEAVTSPSQLSVSESGLARGPGPADTLDDWTRTPLSTSTSSSSSQIVCPRSVDKEKEGFRQIDGTYVSRHNFTASGSDTMLAEAMVRVQNASRPRFHQETPMDIDSPPPRRRNSSETGDAESEKWVKISHQEYTSASGSKIEMLRQKEINLEKVLDRPVIGSPDPNSSFTKSIALLAAAQARHFKSSAHRVEEFGDLDSDSEDESVTLE